MFNRLPGVARLAVQRAGLGSLVGRFDLAGER